MMRKCFLCLIVVLLFPAFSWGLEVAEGLVSTAVEERQPVDSLAVVPADVGRVYCFTRITGAADEVGVSHVWSWQGREMAQVDLSVRSNNWRTWSSKRILPEWKGDWTVSVRDAAGIELSLISFVVE